jgi:hypothetical protein
VIDAAIVEHARSTRIEDELARRGVSLRGRGGERCGPCPRCGGDDRFSINAKKQVWNCRGCATGGGDVALVQHIDGLDFMEAVATLAGAAPAPGRERERAQQPKKLYFPYTDEAGIPLSREVRLQYPDGKKKTWQEAADPDRPGEWIKGEGCMTGVRRVPFELAKLNEGLRKGETIFVVEGPRKCEPLHKWGLCATCNMGGSGAASIWREHAKEFFLPVYSSPVVILPDNDTPGTKSSSLIADALAGVGVAVLDLPGLKPKGDIVNWRDAGGTREQFLDLVKTEARAWEPSERIEVNRGAFARNGAQHKKQEPRKITATPYVWRDPIMIPRREFLYGKFYIRKFISTVVAAGGIGKSSLALVEAIAMATGRPLLGVPVPKRLRVWYWNGEDPKEETERRIAAILLHFKIPPEEIEGWLFTDSGRETPICIAEPHKDGVIFGPMPRRFPKKSPPKRSTFSFLTRSSKLMAFQKTSTAQSTWLRGNMRA